MKIVRRGDVLNSSDHTYGKTGTWDSIRYILARDGVGFSFHVTTLYEGAKIPMWYKNHVEAVYVISGRLGVSWIDDEGSESAETLHPGDLYLLDQHDQHTLYPFSITTVACVFNPPVSGNEDHDEDGAYAVSYDVGQVTISVERYQELINREQALKHMH